MSHKLSLSTAALSAALLAIPLLPAPSATTDTTTAKAQKQSHRPTQDPPLASARDSAVFTPNFGNAANQGVDPTALRKAT